MGDNAARVVRKVGSISICNPPIFLDYKKF